MSRLKLISLFLLSVIVVNAKSKNAKVSEEVKVLISSGNSVYVEVIDVNNSIDDEYNIFLEYLNGDEWTKWNITESKDSANYTCRLTLEKKKAGFSMSYGARVAAYIEILDTNEKLVWISEVQTGNSNEFTGFNAMADAMRKTIRRSLKEQLYEINE